MQFGLFELARGEDADREATALAVFGEAVVAQVLSAHPWYANALTCAVAPLAALDLASATGHASDPALAARLRSDDSSVLRRAPRAYARWLRQ